MPSELARERLFLHRGEPLFVADWMRVLMLHFAVDAQVLQPAVPYPLDLHEGQAYLTLVAFTMERMRPQLGGRLGECLFRPIATHDFLNVRTYVRHHGEPGIHFLAEWLSSWLAVQLGPITFGLPYRYGKITYHHEAKQGRMAGQVTGKDGTLAYRGTLPGSRTFAPCRPGSLAEWLMERYTAFNSTAGMRRYFRIWHPPWPQQAVDIELLDQSLLRQRWRWFRQAKLVGANYSPGIQGVWMGRPHRA